MRDARVEEDARRMAGNPDALRGVKRIIDRAVADHDLAAINHWTSVWFKIQEITLGRDDFASDVHARASSQLWHPVSAGNESTARGGLILSTLGRLSDLPSTIAAALSVVALGAVILVDWLSGSSVSLLIGYIAVVGFASWTLSDVVADMLAVVSAMSISVIVYFQDHALPADDGISSIAPSEIWNFVMTAALLLLFATVIGALRDTRKQRSR